MKNRWLFGTLLLVGGIAVVTLATAQTIVPTAPPALSAVATPHSAMRPRNDIQGVGSFVQISDILSRGLQPTAEGFAALKKMGIKTVIDLCNLHTDRELLKGTGLQYMESPCKEWHPKDEEVLAFLKVLRDPSNQPVFVHWTQREDCAQMMVAAYRMVEEGWSAEEALTELPNFKAHPAWMNYLKNQFDAERVKKKLAEASAVKVERAE